MDSGHRSLDFVNTRQSRWSGGREQLERPEDLTAWLHAAQLLEEQPTATSGDLAAAVALRESLDGLVLASLACRLPPAGALDEVNRWLGRSPEVPVARLEAIEPGELRLRVEPSGALRVERALHVIVLEAARLLSSGRSDRLRICADDECSMRFLDRSNDSTRRWCSKRCSTRSHMRAHRAQEA